MDMDESSSYKAEYNQKFRKAWIKDQRFKDWLEPVTGNKSLALCKLCNVTITAHLTTIKRHAKGQKHITTLGQLDQLGSLSSVIDFASVALPVDQQLLEYSGNSIENSTVDSDEIDMTILSDVKSKHVATVSALERQINYPGVTRVERGMLICVFCNKVLDHSRDWSIKKHLVSKRHLRLQGASGHVVNSSILAKLPTLKVKVKTFSPASRTKDWVRTCAGMNIPLLRSDHPVVRRFLNAKVENGDTIPGGFQLQDTVLSCVYEEEKIKLREVFRNKPVAVICDEINDEEGRYLLNIFIIPLVKDCEGRVKSYLADTCFLEKPDPNTLSQVVVNAIQMYEISPYDVVVFDTDSVTYMNKSFELLRSGVIPNAVHCTCLGHIINLVSETLREPFEELNKFIRTFSHLFFNAGSRKGRYIDFLKRVLPPEMNSYLAPDLVATRWDSWFLVVQYHAIHFQYYFSWLYEERELYGNSASNSLAEIQKFLVDDRLRAVLEIQLKFVDELCPPILNCFSYFDSQKPCTLYAYEKLEELLMYLESQCSSLEDKSAFKFVPYWNESVLLQHEQQDMLMLFAQAIGRSADKLRKYIADEKGGQPAIRFLKSCRVFNPVRISVLSGDVSDYHAVPGFVGNIPPHELKLYKEVLAKEALCSGVPPATVDIDSFWLSARDRVPRLASVALRYKDCVINSADGERSSKLHKILSSCHQQSLGPDMVKELLFLYYNLNVGRDPIAVVTKEEMTLMM